MPLLNKFTQSEMGEGEKGLCLEVEALAELALPGSLHHCPMGAWCHSLNSQSSVLFPFPGSHSVLPGMAFSCFLQAGSPPALGGPSLTFTLIFLDRFFFFLKNYSNVWVK